MILLDVVLKKMGLYLKKNILIKKIINLFLNQSAKRKNILKLMSGFFDSDSSVAIARVPSNFYELVKNQKDTTSKI